MTHSQRQRRNKIKAAHKAQERHERLMRQRRPEKVSSCGPAVYLATVGLGIEKYGV